MGQVKAPFHAEIFGIETLLQKKMLKQIEPAQRVIICDCFPFSFFIPPQTKDTGCRGSGPNEKSWKKQHDGGQALGESKNFGMVENRPMILHVMILGRISGPINHQDAWFS